MTISDSTEGEQERIDFTLAQLEHLVAAVDTENMTLAARSLHTSQSNVSTSISTLERKLNTKLLVRHRSKGVSATPKGEEMAVKARKLLDAALEMQRSVHPASNALTGVVKVGVFYSMAPFYVPRLLQEMNEQAPGMQIMVREASLDALSQMVKNSEIDLALVYDQQLPQYLTFTEMATVVPYVIVSADSPWANHKDISLSELTTTPMVTYDLPITMEHGRQIFYELGLTPPPEVHSTSFETGRAMVAAGSGFAVMNQRTSIDVTADGKSIVPLEISDPITPLKIGTLTRSAKPKRILCMIQDVLATEAMLRHANTEES